MSSDPTSSQRRSSILNLRPQPTPSVPGYHVLEVLGVGRNGTVYRAIQLSMQREVALRVLVPRLTRVAGFAERFMQEVRSASGVHHPNVVSCYEVGQIEGIIFQAMELVVGRTLGQLQATHPQGLAVAQTLELAVSAARGLEGIYRGGLVHGDVRLSNIFVSDDDTVKLADFGLLRSLEVLRDDSEAVSGLGTLAPEQVTHTAPNDIRADIYGIGAALFVLLTGRQPFSGRSRRELEHMIRTAPLPDPQKQVADLSDDLVAVIAKAMARNPVDRYATPGQLREDLERVQYDFVPIHAMPLTTGPVVLSAQIQQPGLVQPLPRASSSPTSTIEHDARFLLIPRTEALSTALPVRSLVAAGVGAVVLGAAFWWWFALPTNPLPVIPQIASPTTSVDVPAWAAAAGVDAQGRWADLVVRGISFRLRSLPAGRFVMGTIDTDPAHRPDEKAVSVSLTRGFWIADSEVTQAQYRAVTGNRPSSFSGDDLPVENVTWHDAVSFAQRLNALVPGLRVRLPSEAEWEYACRAGADQADQITSGVGWFNATEVTAPRSVKRLPANRWGLHDMLGNVAEWCQDHYGPYPIEPATDPLRVEGVSRVVRGGSWAVDLAEGRPTTRGKYLPVAHHAHIGFRIVIDE